MPEAKHARLEASTRGIERPTPASASQREVPQLGNNEIDLDGASPSVFTQQPARMGNGASDLLTDEQVDQIEKFMTGFEGFNIAGFDIGEFSGNASEIQTSVSRSLFLTSIL